MYKFIKFIPDMKSVSVTFDTDGNLIYKDKSVDDDGNFIGIAPNPMYSQHFMRNENGFPINDIYLYENAESDTVANQVLQRLQILHPENAASGQSVSDLMNQVIPANYSTPAEYAKITAKLAENWYQKQVQLENARMAQRKTRQPKNTESNVESKADKTRQPKNTESNVESKED